MYRGVYRGGWRGNKSNNRIKSHNKLYIMNYYHIILFTGNYGVCYAG